ncbi:carbohydrate kinase family protein [Amycolatopsis thermophila]|uniref:Sugar/nucleoside kinase (Ribokinase family) n=1 Tax=Amycolatopsis thermophila TaxID=206084 RepID=A0ABU0F189_9PSEU|nr:carbohydrate kinase family protein [Amycolatopsis thermophila]MDQ0381330.1 sugar/nucleoside kinase (ribokinase family) [Amycolatopsis thermophila]
MTPKVVCLGAHIFDVLGRPVSAIPPGQGRLALDEIKVTAAGTAGGTAVDLAKLGAEVTSFGAIGDDTAGRVLRLLLGEQGVTERLAVKAGRATPASILPIRPNGERPSLHAAGAMDALTADDVDWAAVAEADVLHVGGPDALGGFTTSVLPELLRFARDHGTITTMDLLRTSVPPGLLEDLRPSLRHTQYLLPNDDQIRALTGTADLHRAAGLVRAHGVGTVVVTRGGDGSLVAGRTGFTGIPAFGVPVVDTTGCGDAYSAGFIVGLCHGWDVLDAARLGTAASALVAQGLGSDAGITDLAGTLRFWSERPADLGGAAPPRSPLASGT